MIGDVTTTNKIVHRQDSDKQWICSLIELYKQVRSYLLFTSWKNITCADPTVQAPSTDGSTVGGLWPAPVIRRSLAPKRETTKTIKNRKHNAKYFRRY